MQVKALLCDFAEVAQGKLFISGANINRLGVGPEAPHGVNIAVAMVVHIPWNSTNRAHTLTVELVNEGGASGPERVQLSDMLPPNHDQSDLGKVVAEFNAGRGPDMTPGEETLMPIALPFFGLGLPNPGGYFFAIAVDGTEVDRVSFRVDVINPMNFPPRF